MDCQLLVFQLSVKRMGYESAVYREFKFCCEKLEGEGTLIFFVRKNLCRVFFSALPVPPFCPPFVRVNRCFGVFVCLI